MWHEVHVNIRFLLGRLYIQTFIMLMEFLRLAIYNTRGNIINGIRKLKYTSTESNSGRIQYISLNINF